MVIPLKFARAIEQAGIRSHVVNVSNPEIVNAILGRLGIEPICGSGNSENLHTVLRYVAARMLDARHERILVRMIAHHNHVAELDNPALMEEAPFWYAVELDGRDVTADLDDRGFLDAVRKACPHNRAMCGASSSVKNVLRLLDTDTFLTYCSSPLGRAGGRDVRMSKAGLEIVLPAGMSEEKADAIIDAAQRREGIESIGAEGEVEFVGSTAAALAEWLGYDCKVLYPDEAEERAYELLRKIDAFCERGFTPAKAG